MLNWRFYTGHNSTDTTRVSAEITYKGHEIHLQDLSEKSRKALVNLLLQLERDLPHAPRND